VDDSGWVGGRPEFSKSFLAVNERLDQRLRVGLTPFDILTEGSENTIDLLTKESKGHNDLVKFVVPPRKSGSHVTTQFRVRGQILPPNLVEQILYAVCAHSSILPRPDRHDRGHAALR
jgi:hypothetical protein